MDRYEDAAELLRRLPTDLAPERRAVVETACRLAGKVNCFWGGKSRALGWNSSGNIPIIHCIYGYNNVVITGQEGFASIGRPKYYGS